MTSRRDPVPPRLSGLFGGAGLMMGINVLVIVAIVLGAADASHPVSTAGFALFVSHGLWQWAYALPLSWRLRSRGLRIGVLLGASLYTCSHVGIVLFVWAVLGTT